MTIFDVEHISVPALTSMSLGSSMMSPVPKPIGTLAGCLAWWVAVAGLTISLAWWVAVAELTISWLCCETWLLVIPQLLKVVSQSEGRARILPTLQVAPASCIR